MSTLDETQLSSERVFEGRFLKINRDRVRLPDGAESFREYVVHPGAAVMVPIFDDGRILIERQYRYALRQSFIEVPAGKRDPGEDFFATAQRELLEETGYEAREWARMTQLHPAIGFATEVMEIWLCRDLHHRGQQLDEHEFLELEIVSIDWLLAEVLAGRVTDVKTQIVALWLDRFRSGLWPWPAFQPATALSAASVAR
ncbi:MAG: ADP-ribose pyrophosphatase [Pseudomonadota bacterium]|jgi:ADP-ribose pyrophosphatase